MGYLILLGGVLLAFMLAVTVGLLAGWITRSAVAASLASCLLYGVLLAAGCWLIMPPPPPVGVAPQLAQLNARVHAQTVQQVINFGVFCFLIGGSICALAPIVLRRAFRRPATPTSPWGTRDRI